MFQNREEAGERLAARFAGMPLRDPLVVGLPRGGIVVGVALARRLGADFDLMLARKLAMPGLGEHFAGVVGEDGGLLLYEHPDALTAHALYAEIERLRREVAQRRQRLRGLVAPKPVSGRSVIVVDDGLATGWAVLAALRTLRPLQPEELIVAVPVAAEGSLEALAHECDRVLCLKTPELFSGVGRYYAENPPLDDAALLRVLRAACLPPLEPSRAPRRDDDEPLHMYTARNGAAAE